VSQEGLAGGPEDCGLGGAGVFCQWPSRGVPVVVTDSIFFKNNITDNLRGDFFGLNIFLSSIPSFLFIALPNAR